MKEKFEPGPNVSGPQIEPGRCPGGVVAEVEVDDEPQTGYQAVDLQHAIEYSWMTSLAAFRVAQRSVILRVYGGDTGKLVALVKWSIVLGTDANAAITENAPPGVN